MMKFSTFLLLFIFSTNSIYSQGIPEVKLGDSSSLGLSELHIKVDIVGNIATTKYHMKFYNSTNRVLEGQLAFPLGQGQSVTDFAMDVNGNLRHAVIVEKELGRVAYENTVRQVIDPGLLEMTKGNNYKARVYPIPANGFKEIEITYEQALFANDGKHIYELPLNFKNKLSDFSIHIAVSDEMTIQLSENHFYDGFEFTENRQSGKFKSKNFVPKVPIIIEFSLDEIESVTTTDNYFNIYKVLESKQKLKSKPKSITILWDASYSMQNRNLKKEIDFLDEYFTYLKDVKLELVTFNNKIKASKKIEVRDGNWKEVKDQIQSVVYDGGTSFIDLYNYRSDEFLLFSDGLDNLGDTNKNLKTALYAINASTSANHESLSNKSVQSGGSYINLNILSVVNAFELVKNDTYQFLGIEKNSDVYDVFPAKNTNVVGDFSISGRFRKNTEVTLLFGYNNIIVDKIKVNISKQANNPIVKRIWAKQKLEFLSSNSDQHKNEIITIAKKYGLITDYTSMIILDRIEDYVRYQIEPPAELKSRYKELMVFAQEEKVERQEELLDRKEDLYDDYNQLIKWYNTDFSKSKKPQKSLKSDPTNQIANSSVTIENQNQAVSQSNSQPSQESTTNQNRNNVNQNSNIQIDSTKRFIYGIVMDADGLPLPGVNVSVKGTSRGTQSDFVGNYAINVERGQILTYSFLGMVSSEKEVGDNDLINIKLQEDASMLEEVVVTGYAVQRKSSVSSSLSTVTSESLESSLNNAYTQSLQGKVSGVQIEQNNGQPGSTASIRIRGSNSIGSDNEPLYIVDGMPYTEESYMELKTKDIDNIRVLKDGAGSAIYGNRGANEVVIITTKEGLETNFEKINELNKKIEEEIKFKPWTPNAAYLQELANTKSVEEAYDKYIEIRPIYKNTPTFFIDVAEYFESINEKEVAVQILTNLIEIDLDNHELIRALAYKLEYFNEFDLSVFVYETVLELRPEEPQSYRDLALAYETIGKHQQAFDLLNKIVEGELLEKDIDERFYGIEQIAYVEACHLIAKYNKDIQLNRKQKKLYKNIEVDVRVVVDWNHNDTDLDLWVVNPSSEKLLYNNKNSNDGGRISEDMTEGYGPEEFMITKAKRGDYEILIDYYADEIQKISGPTTLKITMFTNYGKKNEIKKIKVYRLDKEEEEIEVGKVIF